MHVYRPSPIEPIGPDPALARAETAALGVIQGIAEDLKTLVATANPNTIVAEVDKIARALHDHAAIIAAAIVADIKDPDSDPA